MKLVNVDEVLKLIEKIKCDDNIPKNYGTLLDIMRIIRNMPTVVDTKEIIKQLEDGIEDILYDRCYSSDYQLGMMDIRKLLEKAFKGGGVNE